MCLVAFSWKTHDEFPLILSANRDEFFDRPTQALHQWKNGAIAGKDLRGGGTWMGFHPNGRWSFLTNYRDFTNKRAGDFSRGKLVVDFLESPLEPEAYLESVLREKERYEGFNLLVSDGDKLFYLSNYAEAIQEVQPGIHGLSNGLLNDPWPKVSLAKDQISEVVSSEINAEKLLRILKSTATHPLELLPKTGIPDQMEIGLSAQLIRLEPNYGTVSGTSVIQNRKGKTQITERSFQWDYAQFSDQSITFQSSKP